jgi:hypothetical protein
LIVSTKIQHGLLLQYYDQEIPLLDIPKRKECITTQKPMFLAGVLKKERKAPNWKNWSESVNCYYNKIPMTVLESLIFWVIKNAWVIYKEQRLFLTTLKYGKSKIKVLASGESFSAMS